MGHSGVMFAAFTIRPHLADSASWNLASSSEGYRSVLAEAQARDTTTAAAERLTRGIVAAHYLAATPARHARCGQAQQLRAARIPEDDALPCVHDEEAINRAKQQLVERTHGDHRWWFMRSDLRYNSGIPVTSCFLSCDGEFP